MLTLTQQQQEIETFIKSLDSYTQLIFNNLVENLSQIPEYTLSEIAEDFLMYEKVVFHLKSIQLLEIPDPNSEDKDLYKLALFAFYFWRLAESNKSIS